MRRLKAARKAQVVQMGTAIYWMVFLVLQIIAIGYLTRMFIQVSIDIKDVEARVFLNKAIYSPYGITYYDPEIGRLYPNIIDFSRFDTKYIESAVYNPEAFRIGMKLELKNMNGDEIKTIFMDEEAFFADVYSTFEERLVVIDYGGRREAGILQVSVA